MYTFLVGHVRRQYRVRPDVNPRPLLTTKTITATTTVNRIEFSRTYKTILYSNMTD